MLVTSLLELDPHTGIERIMHLDDESGDMTIQTRLDVEPIMEDMRARYNEYDERTPWKGDGLHHVGAIPLNILYQIRRRHPDDRAARDLAALRWIEENPKFRSRPGRLT